MNNCIRCKEWHLQGLSDTCPQCDLIMEANKTIKKVKSHFCESFCSFNKEITQKLRETEAKLAMAREALVKISCGIPGHDNRTVTKCCVAKEALAALDDEWEVVDVGAVFQKGDGTKARGRDRWYADEYISPCEELGKYKAKLLIKKGK